MAYENILFEKRDRVAFVTLNRPQALNSLSPALVAELSQALAEVRADTSLKALVIQGAGKAFCAGADLKFFQEKGLSDLGALLTYVKEFNEFLFGLEELPLPVIAVVQGYALAGGLELAMACDIVLAAEDAVIGDQHVNFALMPGGGDTQRLPRKIGLPRAMALMLTGRWLSGKEAESWGLVYKAVPADRLSQELEELLGQLRGKSREAMGIIKETVRRGLELPLREAVWLEVNAFAQYLHVSSHPKEGIQAFVEKRQPNF